MLRRLADVVFMLCTVCCFHRVRASGRFELKLTRFTNDGGVLQTGSCCSVTSSSSSSQDNRCSACRTAVRVCLTHYQSHVDLRANCTYGAYRTPALTESSTAGASFEPQRTAFVQAHPIRFGFNDITWTEWFSLVVEFWHVTSDSQSAIANSENSQLIARFETSDHVSPTPSSGRENWKDRKLQRANHSVELAYSVRCEDHYYGSGCVDFCRPHDSLVVGHYTCDLTGRKVCLPGWSSAGDGSICRKPICSEGCDEKHGACSKPGECRCTYGWKGPRCDECIRFDGCVHGTCSEPNQCVCREGWGGHYCNQDLNYCTNNSPCKNNGTCSNTGEGSYTCVCPPDFTGADCQFEHDACSSSPCYNGATCEDRYTGYKCTCPPGTRGARCERRSPCADVTCANGGSCVDDDGDDDEARCVCASGWTGERCQAPDACSLSAPPACLNGATCVPVNATRAVCVCAEGYAGLDCSIALPCATLPCRNGATCVDDAAAGAFRCVCAPRFRGRRCTEPAYGTEPEAATELTTEQWVLIVAAALAAIAFVFVAACVVYHRAHLPCVTSRPAPSPKRDGDKRLSRDESAPPTRRLYAVVVEVDEAHAREPPSYEESCTGLLAPSDAVEQSGAAPSDDAAPSKGGERARKIETLC